ncbi:uncharacterized protein BDV17DRAFT_295069 [Aspergillus undulatus]|uniref:uncharacterized protein n=1 Tax=Aspergillus undulatus TaxID=1810928 RepID=UPI003CCDB394
MVLYTVEVVNNSDADDKIYTVFSGKTGVLGGGNNDSSAKAVVWSRIGPLGIGQSDSFAFDNSYYAFSGSIRNGQVYGRENKVATIASNMNEGSIFVLNHTSKFEPYAADNEVRAPSKGQFKILTSSTLTTANNLIGVSRGLDNGNDKIVPLPVTVVPLKPSVTYTFTTTKAVYVKAFDYAVGTTQAVPDDKTQDAVKVEFTGSFTRAVVTEDTNGKFDVAFYLV